MNSVIKRPTIRETIFERLIKLMNDFDFLIKKMYHPLTWKRQKFWPIIESLESS